MGVGRSIHRAHRRRGAPEGVTAAFGGNGGDMGRADDKRSIERDRGLSGRIGVVRLLVPADGRRSLELEPRGWQGHSGQAARLKPEPGTGFGAAQDGLCAVLSWALFDIVRRGRDARAAPCGFGSGLLGFGSD